MNSRCTRMTGKLCELCFNIGLLLDFALHFANDTAELFRFTKNVFFGLIT